MNMSNVKDYSRLACGAFFIGVGLLHFVRTKSFVKIVPSFLRYRKEVVHISGWLEIAGGVGILLPWTRSLAARGLVALLYAVFPANLNMAIQKIDFGYIPKAVLWGRLPLQFLLIKWVKWVSTD
jgi:uncharacterized membrane protein